jgi:hypothetical protein
VDPEIDHQHAPTDAVFMPGLRPFGSPLSSIPSDKMSIGRDASPSDIEIDGQGSIVIADGQNGASRKGDHSDVGTLTLILTGTTVLSGTYVDPDGTPTTVSSGSPITLKAKLSEGSSKVKIG